MKNLFFGLLCVLPSIGVFAEEKATIGLFVGKSYQDATLGDELLSAQDLSIGIGASYTIIQNLKAELAYIHNLEAENTYISDDSEELINAFRSASIDLGLKYGVNLYRDFSLYGHAGVSFWQVDVTEGFSSASDEDREMSGSSPYFSISLDYDWNKNDAVSLEYKVMDMSYESKDVVFENEIRNIALIFKSKF